MSKAEDTTRKASSTTGKDSNTPGIPGKQLSMEKTSSSTEFFEGDGIDDYDDFDIDGKARGEKGQGKQGGPSIYSAKHTRIREARSKTTPKK